ncbi:unnamed protein product, partial [Staurois parvus]
MGPLCPCPKLKKAYEKGTRGILWGPLLTPGPRQCSSFQMVSPPLSNLNTINDMLLE